MAAFPLLLLSTRKGLLVARRGPDGWTIDPTVHFAGIAVECAAVDPRTGTWFAALEHGHWGPKLHRSTDGGHTWTELATPKYPEGEQFRDPWSGKVAAAVLSNIWVLGFGGADQPGRIYAGTNPGALFRSDDHGDSWTLVRPLWDHPSRLGSDGGRPGWFGGGRDTPGIHSIVVHPEDSRRVYIGVSCGGVFETTDDGETWHPRNRGLPAPFLPDPDGETGHDPHFVALCAAQPDVLWQQNHVGIFRSADAGATWTDISEAEGPAKFGFPIVADPVDALRAWVVPARSDGERNAVAGVVQVCETTDGGQTWVSRTSGLPQSGAFDLVYRHALDLSVHNDARLLAFGSTTGNVFLSEDGGGSWSVLSHYLPPVYAVRFAVQ